MKQFNSPYRASIDRAAQLLVHKVLDLRFHALVWLLVLPSRCLWIRAESSFRPSTLMIPLSHQITLRLHHVPHHEDRCMQVQSVA